MASKGTGTSGTLYLYLSIVSSNASNRTYVIRLVAQIKNTSGQTFINNGSWSVSPWGASGGFSISGSEHITVYDGTTTIQLNAAGDGRSVTQTFTMGSTGTSGLGGPTSVSETLWLPALKVLPPAPTGLTAVRVSDSQLRLNWAQAGFGGNGAPTQHVIQRRLNQPAGTAPDAGWDSGSIISPGTTAVVSADVNQKWEFRLWARNSVGQRVSNVSNAVHTTPAAPTNAKAVKDPSQDIVISFTNNVAHDYYNHEVWHGVVASGSTTWDSSPLTVLPAGTFSYLHDNPNSSQVHIYRVRAKIGDLYSGYDTTSAVQLLVAPNKPTFPALPPAHDRATPITFTWVHNPQDTTPQSAYEFAYSLNGGSTWTSSGKVASTVSSRTIAANTFAANASVQSRVRTWGQAATGGSDGTGASPWSDVRAIVMKSAPTASITLPANGSTLNEATVRVSLGFAQAQGATFVKGTIQLLQGGAVIEELDTTNQTGTRLTTQVENSTAYQIKARVQDSNGLWSAWVTNSFNVVYLAPVLPVVTLDYLEESGWGQVNLVIPDPGEGQSAVATVTITRRINGGPEEVLVAEFPASDELTFFDTTPTIHGTNTYTITATTALGAQRTLTRDLVTAECRKAFLSKGGSYSNVVAFGANLEVDEALSVASATVQAAGRTKPIGLYGIETSVQLKVKSFVFENFGSPLDELRAFLLVPGKTCFRDSTGRRTFGTVHGSVDYKKTTRGDLKFTLIETS